MYVYASVLFIKFPLSIEKVIFFVLIMFDLGFASIWIYLKYIQWITAFILEYVLHIYKHISSSIKIDNGMILFSFK